MRAGGWTACVLCSIIDAAVINNYCTLNALYPSLQKHCVVPQHGTTPRQLSPIFLQSKISLFSSLSPSIASRARRILSRLNSSLKKTLETLQFDTEVLIKHGRDGNGSRGSQGSGDISSDPLPSLEQGFPDSLCKGTVLFFNIFVICVRQRSHCLNSYCYNNVRK